MSPTPSWPLPAWRIKGEDFFTSRFWEPGNWEKLKREAEYTGFKVDLFSDGC